MWFAVDMRNHGNSPWDHRHDYPAMADDLAKVIVAQGQAMDVLGHSMGGKAAMVLALMRPDLVNRLLVADIAPGRICAFATPFGAGNARHGIGRSVDPGRG